MPFMSRRRSGFTLVELLIIAPFAILLIGGLIALATQAANSGLRAHARTQIQSDVLYALDLIEQDIRTSVHISSHSSTQIALDGLATDINPQDPSRKLVRNSDCALVTSVTSLSQATKYWLSYYTGAGGNSLLRRYSFADKWCGGSQSAQGSIAWQAHEEPEYILRDATVNLSLAYDELPGTLSADAVRVTLTATRMVAGREVSYTGTIYSKSINI